MPVRAHLDSRDDLRPDPVGDADAVGEMALENGPDLLLGLRSDGEGAVEEVGVRSTRIRTANNSLISVPNGKFADSTIDNMGRRKYRRYTTNISITYDTDPKLIDEFVDGLRQIVEQHPKTRKDTYQVHLNSFGESSLNILFNIFFKRY